MQMDSSDVNNVSDNVDWGIVIKCLMGSDTVVGVIVQNLFCGKIVVFLFIAVQFICLFLVRQFEASDCLTDVNNGICKEGKRK